ncbi:MAG: GNAT family N-acetyltransferase [Alphaproteobacteria bacterium]
MEVVCNGVDAAEWDAFVERQPRARFSHLSAYACVEKTYGYRPHYLAFRKAGRIVAVLPAFEARSYLFGRKLVSQPFSEYGGLLLDETLNGDDAAAIIDLLERHLRDNALPTLEMHGPGSLDRDIRQRRLLQANEQLCAYLVLDRPMETLWEKAFNRHVRKAVNKARREGLDVVERCDQDIILDRFFPLYLDSTARLGVPPHPARYFLDCLEAFGPRMKIFWALKDGKFLAGLLGFACGRRVAITNTVSDPDSWILRPNDLVHHDFIAWSVANGYGFFDFGSARYGGQQQYKKKWGCETEDDSYYFLRPEGAAQRVATFNSSSSGMALMSKIWARTMPRPAARLLGPHIRRHLVR